MRRSFGIVVAAACVAMAMDAHATCFDKVQDGPESDVDCGGDCIPCERGDLCRYPRDCYSGRCSDGVCTEREYLKGEPVPPGYRVETSTADGAAIARTIGWISLGLGYGVAYVSALSLPGKVSALYIPVAGPWIEVSDSGQGLRGLIAVDGFFQTVGAGLVVGGIAAGGKQLVRDDPVLARFWILPAQFGRDGYGLYAHALF